MRNQWNFRNAEHTNEGDTKQNPLQIEQQAKGMSLELNRVAHICKKLDKSCLICPYFMTP